MTQAEKDEGHQSKQSRLSKKEINDHITFFASSDTKYAIVTMLGMYEMLNLKALARIIGKSQSTIHKHLEDLMNRGYIEIANTMKGKFYQLSDLVNQISSDQKEAFNEANISLELENLKMMDDATFFEQTLDKFEDKNETLNSDTILNFRSLLEVSMTTNKIVEQASIVNSASNFYHIYLFYLTRLVKEKNTTKLQDEIDKIYNSENHNEKLINYLKRINKSVNELSLEDYQEVCIKILPDKQYQDLLQLYLSDEHEYSQIWKVFSVGELEIVSSHFKISGKKQLVEYLELLYGFFKDLEELKERFNIANKDVDEELLTTQFVSFYTGALSKKVNLE